MTSTEYWGKSPYKYPVVIAEHELHNACDFLYDSGYPEHWSWHWLDRDRIVFDFLNEDTALLFKLRWS